MNAIVHACEYCNDVVKKMQIYIVEMNDGPTS